MKMHKILIISYFYKPLKSVGVLRAAYWYEQLKYLGYYIDLITNYGDGIIDPNIIVIKKEKSLLTNIIPDEGVAWISPLTRYLIDDKEIFKYDNVIITGGPFLHFLIVKKLKKIKPDLNIILDYRDPFSNNPRFKNTFIKSKIKERVEIYVNKYANEIITVNKTCAKLIKAKQDLKIIENGFDDRLFANTNYKKNNNQVFFAGKIYDVDINPLKHAIPILSSIDFMFFGDNIATSNYKNYHWNDFVLPEVLMNYMTKASIGIVFTGGAPFQSTTKIFDYIACKLKIIIITEGEKNTGNIYEIIKKNPNVEWSYNNIEDIIYNINLLCKRDYIDWDYNAYSRQVGLKKLINLLK